jgi:phage terminase large subunit GpA-like protein
MDLSEGRYLALKAFDRGWEPKTPLTVSEWADANRVLSIVGSAEPGQWHTSRNPMLREIMDQLSENSKADLVAVMKSSQGGGTECGSNWLGYIMTHAKGPAAVVMPTDKSMDDWVSQKFDPMTSSTPAIGKVLAKRSNSGADNSAQRKKFIGGILYFKTAGSTADLKSTSLRYALADEVDEWVWDTKQGDPLGLLQVRLTTFHDGKLFAVSSPMMRDASRIEELFDGGDKRRYHVPCPHCRELQNLIWTNLRFSRHPDNPKRVTEAWYVCRECGAEIQENEKAQMLPEVGRGGQARWIAEAPGAPYPSYHFNSIYAPIGLGRTWVQLANEWIEAQEDKAKLMRFMNTRLGETWADRTHDIKANALEARAEPYDLRTIPAGVMLMTVGVDVQDNRFEIQAIGHGRHDVTFTLDYHILFCDPADEASWDKLAEYVNGMNFANPWGKILRAEATAIDTGGHHTHAAYVFVRSGKIRRGMAIKGASNPGRHILGKPSQQDVTWKGKTAKKGVLLYPVGTDTAKHLLYSRLNGDTDKDPSDRKVRFSQQLESGYYDGLVSETFNPRRNRWEVKKGKRNEPLDTWNYAIAASHHPELYLHKWKAADWESRRQMLEPDLPAGADAPAQPEVIGIGSAIDLKQWKRA